MTLLKLFRFSHFCEKVSWAADYSSLKIQRHYLYPGLHSSEVVKLSGQSAVPILCDGDKVVTGSARIIEWINAHDEHYDIYPQTPEGVQEFKRLQARYDDLGAASRGGMFEHLLTAPHAAGKLFTSGSGLASLGYPAFMIMAGPMLKKRITKNRSEIDAGLVKLEQELDELETRLSGRNYLLENRFTSADLVVASMLFPLCFPSECGHQLSPKLQQALGPWLKRWRGYAALDWVKDIYYRHRHRTTS
ncbi:MAG: glutathione S-transferase family protein [Pseudomonadota bacterium]